MIGRSLRNFMERHEIGPGKGAAVGLLALVFVIVVTVQVARFAGGPVIPVETDASVTPVVRVAPAEPGRASRSEESDRAVPMVPVDGNGRLTDRSASERTTGDSDDRPPLVRDPFAGRRTSERAEAAETNAAGEAAGNGSTDSPPYADRIVIGPTGASARIGDRWLKVGDLWNGYRVVEIRSDGVELVAE